jgi:hypothetical protein
VISDSLDDEEYHRFLQRGREEQERLRAAREAHMPEAKWPTDKEYITVAQAASIFIEVGRPSLYTKPNGSGVRRDIIKTLRHPRLVKLILRWAQEDRIELVDPILGDSEPCPPDPDEEYCMGPETFERIKNARANGVAPAVLPKPAVIEATVPPIGSSDGEAVARAGADRIAKAADERMSNALPGAEAIKCWPPESHEAAPSATVTDGDGGPEHRFDFDRDPETDHCAAASFPEHKIEPDLPTTEEEEKKPQFLEWGENEKKKHGSYPLLQPCKRGRDSVREWATRNRVRRKIAEDWAKELGWARERGRPSNKSAI